MTKSSSVEEKQSYQGLGDALMKSISLLETNRDRFNALKEVYTSMFRYKLRKSSAKALFAANLLVDGYSNSCPEKSNVRFQLCYAILFGSGTNTMSAFTKLFAQVLPGIVPKLKNIRRFTSTFRECLLPEWEPQNTPTGMRVNLVSAVRVFHIIIWCILYVCWVLNHNHVVAHMNCFAIKLFLVVLFSCH